MTENPADDQREARLRDPRRFLKLVRPHMTGPDDEPVSAVYARMPTADAAEARSICDRLARISEDPAITDSRTEELLRLAELERILHDVQARPHWEVSSGKVVTDPETGQPVPDDTFTRKVRRQLNVIDRMRQRLTGLPPAGGPDAAAS